MTEQFAHPHHFQKDRPAELLGNSMPGLTDQDWLLLGGLRSVHRFVGRGRHLLNENEDVTMLKVICKGWAVRCSAIDKDRRQILDFLLPGDVVGLNVDGRGQALSDVIALTPCEVAEVDQTALHRLSSQSSGITDGIQYLLKRNIARTCDQAVRLGRMTAYERVVSLFLDIFFRQHSTMSEGTVDFPITQTVAADALGLSVVHVNRQVMRLRREGEVALTRRQLTLFDPVRLSETVGYRDRGFNNLPSAIAAE
jgi:CRP-like cAMP-binding protein